MSVAVRLLEAVFDLLESQEEEDVDVVILNALRHIVGTRSGFRSELERERAEVQS